MYLLQEVETKEESIVIRKEPQIIIIWPCVFQLMEAERGEEFRGDGCTVCGVHLLQ
jgi:hypothetical protein